MTFLFENTSIIQWGGVAIVAALVFAETGLLLGLIIPGGETLVFTAGLLTSTGVLDISVMWLLLILVASGVLGDISGYFIGKKFGRKLYSKNDTWYFKKQYLYAAEKHLRKHSKLAIILGKFLPVIRPFTPVICGTTNFEFRSFVSLSIVASLLYMSSFSLIGHFLGRSFPQIKDYIGWILPVSIVVSLIPVVMQLRKSKRESNHQQKA